MQSEATTRRQSAVVMIAVAAALLMAGTPASAQDREATQPQAAQVETQATQVDAGPLAEAQPPIAAPEADALTPPPVDASTNKPLPHELSPLGMFQAADIVVKTVMIALVLASFLTWTVFFAKTAELWAAKRRLRETIANLETVQSLDAAAEAVAQTKGPGAAIVGEAAREIQRSRTLGDASRDGIKERVASRLSRAEARASRRVMTGIGIVATIGSVAPFVGLFGTVWGIMNAFIGISKAQTTNLAVVAPGIAEALLATALGLVAAIPAVVVYNAFARQITDYRQLLADASAAVERLVSFDLDAGCMTRPRIKAAAE